MTHFDGARWRSRGLPGELDALAGRLRRGPVTIRSDWRWQLWSALAALCAAVIPAALLSGLMREGLAMRWMLLAVGAVVIGVVWFELVLLSRMLTGRPTLTLHPDGFSLHGGELVPWTMVDYVSTPETPRRVRGQPIRARAVRGQERAVLRLLPRAVRARRRALRILYILLRSDSYGPNDVLTVRLIRHPTVPADVIADLADALIRRSRG